MRGTLDTSRPAGRTIFASRASQVGQPRIAFRGVRIRAEGGEELVLHPVRVLGGLRAGALAGEDGGFLASALFRSVMSRKTT